MYDVVFLPADGPDFIQQWGEFNLGAQSSRPFLDHERKTQSQSAGQSAVSDSQTYKSV